MFNKATNPNYNGIGNALNSIGLIYDHQQKKDKALDHYEEARQMLCKETHPNNESIGTVLNNIGLLYDNEKK